MYTYKFLKHFNVFGYNDTGMTPDFLQQNPPENCSATPGCGEFFGNKTNNSHQNSHQNNNSQSNNNNQHNNQHNNNHNNNHNNQHQHSSPPQKPLMKKGE